MYACSNTQIFKESLLDNYEGVRDERSSLKYYFHRVYISIHALHPINITFSTPIDLIIHIRVCSLTTEKTLGPQQTIRKTNTQTVSRQTVR